MTNAASSPSAETSVPTDSSELVVLLDEAGQPIGTAPKATVHTTETPLHLAFSCYVLNSDGDVLITRRALSKQAWPGVWTNSFCGHPGPGESTEAAIERRAAHELGLTVTGTRVVLPDFRYRATDASGIVENEVCPVYVAHTTSQPTPNPDEVAEWQWVSPEQLATIATETPWLMSPWAGWQLQQFPEQAWHGESERGTA